jgi:hypothetical protein
LRNFLLTRCKLSCEKWRVIPPLRCRKIQADMKLKALSLADVADLTGIKRWRICKILKGREVHRDTLIEIEQAVKHAPMPKEELV